MFDFHPNMNKESKSFYHKIESLRLKIQRRVTMETLFGTSVKIIFIVSFTVLLFMYWKHLQTVGQHAPMIRNGINFDVKSQQRVVNPKSRHKKTIVILVANQRSGSTFLGEIFNQNPSVFYLFEPLFPFSKKCETLKQERTNLLDEMSRCNFKTMKNAYKEAFAVTKFSDTSAQCVKHNLCFDASHKPLLNKYAQVCETAAGGSLNSNKFDPDSKTCGFPLNSTILSSVCEKNEILVFKLLRLCGLESIEPTYRALTEDGFDVYILHLIRDPRAVIASRLEVHVDGLQMHDAPSEIGVLCDRYKRNMKYVEEKKQEKGSPSFVTDQRYLRVRHEDIALGSYAVSNSIYKFIGKELPKTVEIYLSKSFQSIQKIEKRIEREDRKAIREKREIRAYSKSKQIMNQMKNPFGTVRDPDEVLTKWRKQLHYSIVELVQEECRSVMPIMGYRLFHSNVDLINLTNPNIV